MNIPKLYFAYTFHILTSPNRIERSAPADSVWLEYAYQKHHPVLQYLPTKLAAEKGQLHVRPGRHQSPTSVIQHLEPMVLPGGGPMEAMGVQKPSSTPILYVGLAADVLGPVPLMPLFLLGNSTPSLRHPTPAPPAQERQVSTWAGRCSRRVGQEGKQRV